MSTAKQPPPHPFHRGSARGIHSRRAGLAGLFLHGTLELRADKRCHDLLPQEASSSPPCSACWPAAGAQDAFAKESKRSRGILVRASAIMPVSNSRCWPFASRSQAGNTRRGFTEPAVRAGQRRATQGMATERRTHTPPCRLDTHTFWSRCSSRAERLLSWIINIANCLFFSSYLKRERARWAPTGTCFSLSVLRRGCGCLEAVLSQSAARCSLANAKLGTIRLKLKGSRKFVRFLGI